MAIALETVVKQLADSGIIARGALENFVPPKATPKDGEALLRELHKQGLLTTFQARQVAANKTRALLLGEYTILDRIGAGGMGQVFKAVHRRMDRTVAIKMLPPTMTKDAASMARFEREVRAAAKLSHPNIVAAYDAGQANGVHFLVMEYVEGNDLSALVKKDGPFPVGKAVDYILQAARGLDFAHKKGVVHRDIKPANLLLDNEAVVKILDMGLARIEGDAVDYQLTSSGTIMGTVDYMAPEQAVNTKSADHRADIYSLGISLYYLLAAKAAYGGETAIEKLMAHQTQPIPSLKQAQTTVPTALDAVFRKMVAKRIEDRYQSMSEVVEALEGLGLGGSATVRKGDVASTVALSSEQKKKLADTAKKKPLGSITEVVASEKTKHLILKIAGGTFATIIAPILVTYLIKHLEKKDEPRNPPVANASAEPATPQTLLPPGEGGRRPDEGQRPSETDLARRHDPLPSPLPKGEGAGAPLPAKAPFDAAQAKAHQSAWAKHLGTKVETINSVGMRMTLIPPGEFLMGSTPEQSAIGRKIAEDDKTAPADHYFGRLAEEMPQHKVTITKPFLMGSTEVTVGQFRKFVEATKYLTEAEKAKDADKGKNWKSPGNAITDGTAVTQITWNDACAYCAWLSEQERRRPWYRPDGRGSWLIAAYADGYRLPTEAEWEYGCRAGTTTQYSFGDDKSQLEQYGWFSKNHRSGPQPVALKLPNPFGLFDIHGNALEWCQDAWDPKWYEKSSPADPNGPSSNSRRIKRGGSWPYGATVCRSAFRSYDSPSVHFVNSGFRIVLPLDPTQPETAQVTTAKSSAPPTNPTKRWETPEFQKWVADTQKLPAEQQLEAVRKRLIELNPGFDGKLIAPSGGDASKPKIKNGVVTEVALKSKEITDLSPLRALAGLRTLRTNCDSLADLSPLSGMTLTSLTVEGCKVADLSPLVQMPLDNLCVYGTKVSDLRPITGMKLSYLIVMTTAVTDLSPLRGMPLKTLSCLSTAVSDLSPLHDCPNLTRLDVQHTKVTPASVAALQKALPNCKIGWDDPSKTLLPPGEGGRRPDEGQKPWNTPAFQAWVKATQALPAEKQIEAVSKKLMELNPGFDGKLTGSNPKDPPYVVGGVVKDVRFPTDNVTDISPLRAFVGLNSLNCSATKAGDGKLSDLSPLQGLPLSIVEFGFTRVSDLSPLSDMKLNKLRCYSTSVSDLSPLKGMPLTYLNVAQTNVLNLSPLKGMPLTYLDVGGTKVLNLSSLEGMPLTVLSFNSTGVSDLSPLRAVSMKMLYCYGTLVTDLSPLHGCKDLESLVVTDTKIPAAQVAALQKALPNCKIEWDDPAKAAAAQPNQPWNTPAFQAWIKATQALPAEQQIEAVSKKLMELNPGFDGKLESVGRGGAPRVENGVVTGLWLNTDVVADLSPLRALAGLKRLACGRTQHSKLADLSPLRGLPLEQFTCGHNDVSDLSPLEGMPLKELSLGGTKVTDLSPIRGMPLTNLNFQGSPVVDLSPVRGMRLSSLNGGGSNVSDLSPIAGMPVVTLIIDPQKITKGIEDLRRMTSLQTIGFDGNNKWPPAEFWKKYDAGEFGRPAAKKLAYLDPAFQQWVAATQALPAEQQIEAVSKKLMELNPGFDGKVTGKSGNGTPNIENGMVTEIGIVTDSVTDISPVRALAGLKVLFANGSRKGNGKLSDLSPLDGMSLTSLACYGTQVSDLSPLQECTSLKTLIVPKTKVAPAGVAALQKALPNCKIEWDDPANAKPPEPAAREGK